MRDGQRTALTRRLSFASTLIGVQMACVGVGLWMQHQFLHTAAQERALESAWSQLSAGTRRLVEVGAGQTIPATAVDSGAGNSFDTLWSSAELGSDTALILDSQWRVRAGSDADVAFAAAGAQAVWTPLSAPGTSLAGVAYGTLEVAGETYVAALAPYPESRDSVAVVRRAAIVEAAATAQFASLPLISGLTFVWTSALLGISAYMICSRFYDHAQRAKERSVAEALRQRQDLIRTRDAIVFGLAKLAESRDRDTGDHLERLSVYTTALAAALRDHPRYADAVSAAFVRLIGISSVLHDIGKVGVEDRILRKSGPLTAQERAQMQKHTKIGGECLRGMERRLGSSNFLQMAREIALCHHEWWDGSGYPNGLRGDQIPLAARIVAIVDVYDALSSRRVYKEALSHEACVEQIQKAAGTQFDPDLVAVWMRIAPRFAELAVRYSSAADGGPDDTGGAVPEPVESAGERSNQPAVALASAASAQNNGE